MVASPTWDLDPGAVYTSTADGTDIGTTLTVGGTALSRVTSATATVQTAGGTKVLRGGNDAGGSSNGLTQFRNSGFAGSVPVSVAFLVDFTTSTVPLYSNIGRLIWGAYQGAQVQRTPSGIRLWDYSSNTYDLPSTGKHLVVVSGGLTVEKTWVDGVLIATDTVSRADSSAHELSWWGDLYRAQVWVGTALTDADAAALWDSLGGQYGLTTPGITASGSWSFPGQVAVTVGEPDVPDVLAGTPGGSATPPPPPEPQLPPAGVDDPVLWRVSEIMPSPVLDARGNPIDWAPTTVVSEAFARIQVVVEGVDITYWDGAPIPVPSWTRTEPFGSAAASIEVPQITPFHQLPAWCVPGAAVDIRLALVAGGVAQSFSGVVNTFGHKADTGTFTVECTGVVLVDDWQLRQPAFLTQPQDVGAVIADVLNSAVSRRHDPVAPVVTGCMTSVLGGWEPRVTGFIQQLLATAVTGGQQWTVKCADRSPVLEIKDITTIGWTVHNGQRGVTIDLTQDWSQAPNVIYGEGIGSDGGRWRNAMYPNWRPDSTPPFPLAPTASFHVGTRDQDTTTGSGVSDWQRKVGLPVTGRYSWPDRDRCIAVQTAAGIQRDGFVGPQTWAATFGTGSNTGTLDCFYMPIAYAPNVMPRLYGPDGDDLGPNPAYNADVLRVEEKIDFGQGVDKAEGIRAGGEYLARSINPGWVGTVAFTIDPEETSRYLVVEGSNGKIRGFRGTDLTVHVAQVDYAEDQVTATVDTNARDFPRLDAIRQRERNATDPAKAYQKRLNQGSITEARATFDAESPAGQVPRFALFGNLWSVVRIPFGSYGSISRTELTTSGSAQPFSVAVFDRPITAARLLDLVGNPLTATDNPWSTAADDLDAAGLLMSWGWASQPAGYYPGEMASPDGATTNPVTGRMVDDASWQYASTQAPWLWVAVIAAAGCQVEGRFWPGAE